MEQSTYLEEVPRALAWSAARAIPAILSHVLSSASRESWIPAPIAGEGVRTLDPKLGTMGIRVCLVGTGWRPDITHLKLLRRNDWAVRKPVGGTNIGAR